MLFEHAQTKAIKVFIDQSLVKRTLKFFVCSKIVIAHVIYTHTFSKLERNTIAF